MTATPEQVREVRNSAKALDQAAQPVVQGTEPLPLEEQYRGKMLNLSLRMADALYDVDVLSEESFLGPGDRVVHKEHTYPLRSGARSADVQVVDTSDGVAFDFASPALHSWKTASSIRCGSGMVPGLVWRCSPATHCGPRSMLRQTCGTYGLIPTWATT
ncbi:hypothetical protein C5022_000059 [Pseudomonas phage vB_PaeP_130_113]|uniref:Uncharacterized protein n=1 Tax=Pseudomonas phage vB_PaeP_130_113 TaxID=2161784 RepID=A0A2R4P9G0_9CAUD|nr:hypothetical protein HOT07_gp59 [Pseudomonas phage vB_PaeP_130_113]AVX47662.1 hypothetical protein C5022_000059 [Pseudomonas phage vB_PaeP_130_113]